jgi:hypothetical protein
MKKDELISRSAAIEHMESMAGCAACNNYDGVRCRACIWDDAMNIVDELPAVEAITLEWMREKMRGYASILKSPELKALVTVMQMWEREQEAR